MNGAHGGKVFYSSNCVLHATMDEWIPRDTQMVTVEIFDVILAMSQRKEEVHWKRVLVMVDAEAVERALVQGFTSVEDVCDLVALIRFVVEEADAEAYIGRFESCRRAIEENVR